MPNTMKHAVLIVMITVLPLAAACSGKQHTPTSVGPQTPSGSATSGPAPASKGSTPVGTVPSKSGEVPALTQAELPAYQKVAACVREHGINQPDPQVGKQFDTSAMDAIAMTPQWNKILTDCPDWTKVVVGVG
jgi:hypothetical protein